MKRDLSSLQSQQFDVLIVGAGVHGACAARDAALRGLTVALIDMGDICGATSHNSLKTIHGGIRYLQHLNFKRSLESIREQKYWLETAPHLVKPLPFLMPTYGYGMRGPLAMWTGIRLFELLGFGRNKRLSPASKLPRGRVLSKQECIDMAPTIPTEDLTGGAFWYDAQVEFADLAVLQVVEHAYQSGACIANYLKAENIQTEDSRVTGVLARDQRSGDTINIRAKTVLNTAGPWASAILDTLSDSQGGAKSGAEYRPLQMPLTKSMNLVTSRPAQNAAIGVQSNCVSDSVVGDTRRLYFIVPWLGISIIGTTHFRYDGSPDDLTIDSHEVKEFIADINHAYPSLNLSESDVLYCQQGLSPADNDLSQRNNNSTPLHHSMVIDHAVDNSIQGLISVVSIKWTTARLLAEQAIDLVTKKLGLNAVCKTRRAALPDSLQFGGGLHSMADEEVISFCKQHMTHSMTVSLVDMLLRRSDDLVLGKLRFPTIKLIARTMSANFQWDAQQQESEQAALQRLWLCAELKTQLAENSLWD